MTHTTDFTTTSSANHMKTINKILSAVLPAISALLLASCIEADNMLGSDLLPDGQNIRTRQVTFDLPVSLKMSDSIATTSSTSIIIGSVRSELFGLSEFGCATTLVPVTDTSRFVAGENIRIKDFRITLQKRRTEAHDPSSEKIIQKFNVYRITKNFDSTTIYNNSFTEEYYDNSAPLSIYSPTYGGEDTLDIYLSEAYALEILDSLSRRPEILDTLNNYNKTFPGIYITCSKPMGGINEGRINNFKAESYGRLRYTADFGERKDVDTSIIFATAVTEATGQYLFALNTSRFESKHMEAGPQTEKLYVQGNAGLKPVISSSYIRRTIQEWAADSIDVERLIITRASIVLPFEFPEDYTVVDRLYPTTLSPSCRIHTEDNRVLYSCISDVYVSSENPGEINRSTCLYSPDITHYLQKMVAKEEDKLSEDDDIWLMPTTKDADKNDENEDSSTDLLNYNYYNPYYYYDPYGYGGYGYGGMYGGAYGGMYGYNPYGYYGAYNYGNSSDTSESQLTLDCNSHFEASMNGQGYGGRSPKLVITYCILPQD